jgi:hypothetical protein
MTDITINDDHDMITINDDHDTITLHGRRARQEETLVANWR